MAWVACDSDTPGGRLKETVRSEEHTSELQSQSNLVCRLLLETTTVCVLGDTVRRKLFPDDPDPIGQVIRLDRLPLRVVGVLDAKGLNPVGAAPDAESFLPITT